MGIKVLLVPFLEYELPLCMRAYESNSSVEIRRTFVAMAHERILERDATSTRADLGS